MPNTSGRLQLTVPNGTGDQPDVPLYLAGFRTQLDSRVVQFSAGTWADRPLFTADSGLGKRGSMYWATDRATLYWQASDANPTNWIPLNTVPQVTELPAPEAAYDGLVLDYVPQPLGGQYVDPDCIWRVKYIAARPLNRRWLILSANCPWGRNNPNNVSWGLASYAGFSSNLAVPRAGLYEYEGGARIGANNGGITCLVPTNGAYGDAAAVASVNATNDSVGSRRFDPYDFAPGGTCYFGHRCGVDGGVVSTRDYWVRYHPRALAAAPTD